MRRATAFLRRAVARWQSGSAPSARDRFSEDGDTLIEVLLSLVVLGIAAVALLRASPPPLRRPASTVTSPRSTRRPGSRPTGHRRRPAGGTEPGEQPVRVRRQLHPDLQQPDGLVHRDLERELLERIGVVPTCTNYVPQQYTLTVSSSGSYGASTVVTTVISDPSSPPPPNGVGAPVQLVWLSQPPYTRHGRVRRSPRSPRWPSRTH